MRGEPCTNCNARNGTGKCTKYNMLNDRWPHESRMFDSQMTKASKSPSFKTNGNPHNEWVLTNEIQNEFSYLFSDIGCFEGTFSLQVKIAVNYIMFLPREWHMYYRSPWKGARETTNKQIIAPLDKWWDIWGWNNLILVLNVNVKVRLCLDLVKLIRRWSNQYIEPQNWTTFYQN